MWRLVNNTPFAAERTFLRDRDGAEVWVVAVKGTFTIRPDGTTEVAEEQEQVLQTPRYQGEPGTSSLLYESDLVHTKPGTDVIVHGHAYAPRGRAAPVVDVSLRIGRLSRQVRVFGDRYWRDGPLGLRMSEPLPFERIPLVYERAFGGTDDAADGSAGPASERRNPIGAGFAAAAERLVDAPLPNLEDPAEPIRSWKQRPRPAGFGPIARDWSPRLELAGTYDDEWERDRMPLVPLDFDDRFYHCAPAEQQVPGFLRGGESVELHNLTPDGFLRFSAPRAHLVFSTRFGRQTVGHRAKLHTVILEPDEPRAILVWHTSLTCHGRDHELEMTRITLKEFV